MVALGSSCRGSLITTHPTAQEKLYIHPQWLPAANQASPQNWHHCKQATAMADGERGSGGFPTERLTQRRSKILLQGVTTHCGIAMRAQSYDDDWTARP